MYIAMLFFLISCSCFRGPPIELASNWFQTLVTLEYKCMRRLKVVENEERSMKIVKTLFETILTQISALHTESAFTKSILTSTGQSPLIEPCSDPSTMSGMMTVLGFVLRLITSRHRHIAYNSTIVLRLALIFLVRVRGSLPRAGTACSSRSFGSHGNLCCSHGYLTVTNLCSAHVRLTGIVGRRIKISFTITSNYYNPLGIVAGISGTEEDRASRRFRHGIIGLTHPLLGPLPLAKSISELIMIYVPL